MALFKQNKMEYPLCRLSLRVIAKLSRGAEIVANKSYTRVIIKGVGADMHIGGAVFWRLVTNGVLIRSSEPPFTYSFNKKYQTNESRARKYN